jgi:metal-responsive CopG/Arc/MetJ family transcriptional regulator
MAKPTTIRIPEDLLEEIEQMVKKKQLDRSAYLREILRKGFSLDRQERLFRDYAQGELSLMEVCKELKCNPWELLSMMQANNLHLNVGLEDWLDTADLTE